MKTYIRIVGDDIPNDPLCVVVDWNAPYFPRVGDLFGYRFLLANIDPEDFYSVLLDDVRKEMLDSVNWRKHGLNDKDIKKEILRSYVTEWQFRISDIYWDMNENSECEAYVWVRIETF